MFFKCFEFRYIFYLVLDLAVLLVLYLLQSLSLKEFEYDSVSASKLIKEYSSSWVSVFIYYCCCVNTKDNIAILNVVNRIIEIRLQRSLLVN